ncbi:protein kinase domain-containing protein [Pseudoalteromonas rubra]|uniref:protein kinase domain-containing protein n=1 Tax=Pseudoalteromonas rubra TaxID=43658 RepID=UPI002DBD5459|nr:protein kinase [Pseudoalteromonas rubra]MEC4091648.1 protein kinase [Pseudoalteromonas rubra]
MDKSHQPSHTTQSADHNIRVQQADLPEHYHVIKVLGEGGMGEVLLAEDTRLNRQVAIKRLKMHGTGEDISVAIAEAQILARLNHTHIVQLYDIITTPSQVFLIMEYVDGNTLLFHQKTHILSLEQKLTLLIQIANGVAAAHQCGVIHCDLKPSNILLDTNQQVKITDFGIARLTQAHEDEHTAKVHQSHGSILAISPEQLRGDTLTPQSDLFSFGVLAYELISGRHPFGKTNIRGRILTGEYDNADEIIPALPEPLCCLLNQLLSTSPKERPADARQVAKRLEHILIALTQNAILEQETVPLHAAPEQQNKAPKISWYTNRRVVFLASFCIMVFTLITFFLTWNSSERTDTTRYIAVLKPPQKNVVSATINQAIRQYILQNEGLELVVYNHEAYSSLQEVASATGATDIITSEIDCSDASCEVTFSRLYGDKWTVQQQISWPMPANTHLNNFYTAQQHAAKLFGEIAPKKVQRWKINQKEYLDYLAIYEDVNTNGAYNIDSLNRLEALLTDAPELSAAYTLLVDVGLNIYHQSKDDAILARLSMKLNNAPISYKQSVLFQREMMLLALEKNDMQAFDIHYEKATARSLSDYDAQIILARKAKKQGALDQSIEHLEKALSLRSSTFVMFNLANDLYLNSQFERAISLLNKIIEITPDDYLANQLLADIFMIQGQLDKAITRYQVVVQKDPQPMDLNMLALTLMLDQQYPAALEVARSLPDVENNTLFLLNLADIEKLNGNMQEATQHYQRVIHLNADQHSMYELLDRAQAHAQLGQFEQAISTLNRAIKLSPDNSEYAFTAALVYALANEQTSAIVHAKAALEVGYGTVWFNLPWFRSLCGNPGFLALLTQESPLCRTSPQPSEV